MTTERRRLRFDDLDAAVAEARRLRAGGYDQAGAWSLAGNCGHLAKFMAYSLDGFPGRFRLPRPVAFLARKILLSPSKLDKPMPANTPTAPYLKPGGDEEGEDDAAAVERFAEQCGRVKANVEAGGSWARSPIFGNVPPDLWPVVHLRHAEHHLGFLVPHTKSV